MHLNPASRRIEELPSRDRELKARLAQLGEMRPGSLIERYRKCGKPNCPGARRGDRGHGPMWRAPALSGIRGPRPLYFFRGAGGSVIRARLKGGGKYGTVRGANAILALRCSKLSGCFEDFWEQRSHRRKAA